MRQFKYTLRSIQKLDMADRIHRVVADHAPMVVRADGMAFSRVTTDGRRYWDCQTRKFIDNERWVSDGWFELSGPRSEVARIIAREVRDLANEQYAARAHLVPA